MDSTTAVYLCSVDLPTKTHQIDFVNKALQDAYFTSKVVKSSLNNTFQNRYKMIRVGINVELISNCNYGYYTNTITDNGSTIQKKYFFRITRKEYGAKGKTNIYFEIDTFQTYMFDFQFHSSFVERETVKNDTIGANVYPESFELGNYVCAKRQEVTQLKSDLLYIIGVSDTDNGIIGGVYGKTYSGIRYRVYNDEDVSMLTAYIKELSDAGHANAIVNLFTYPKEMLSHTTSFVSGDYIDNFTYDEQFIHFAPVIGGFTSQHGIGYTPYNKKLYTYPYNFLQIVNPHGGNVVLKFENFADVTEQEFWLEGTLVASPHFTLTPVLYDNKQVSYEDSIECGGFPLGSWNNDVYANWFAQNSTMLTTQSENARANYLTSSAINQNNLSTDTYNNVIGTASNAVGSILNLQLGSAVEAGVKGYSTQNSLNNTYENASLQTDTTYQNEIRSICAQISTASVQPNSAKGDTSASGLDVARGSNTFYINQMQVKGEIAKMIDMYFQMYGYQVNTVKVPTFNNRQKWDYIKTIGCNITGDIPQEDIDTLCSMFDNGLTIWHSHEYAYNYDTMNYTTNIE